MSSRVGFGLRAVVWRSLTEMIKQLMLSTAAILRGGLGRPCPPPRFLLGPLLSPQVFS